MAEEKKTSEQKKKEEKLKKFLLAGLIIIVVTVNLALLFHYLADKKQNKGREKNFLIGIRHDLYDASTNLGNGIVNYQPTLDYYDSLWAQINSGKINAAYINNHSRYLINTIYLTYDNSRFESFKSSGYFRLVENQKLLRDITGLYTKDLPQQVDRDNTLYENRRREFTTYIGSEVTTDSSGKMRVTDILSDKGFRWQVYWQRNMLQENKQYKKDLLNTLNKVIAEIDKELKDRFNYDALSKK